MVAAPGIGMNVGPAFIPSTDLHNKSQHREVLVFICHVPVARQEDLPVHRFRYLVEYVGMHKAGLGNRVRLYCSKRTTQRCIVIVFRNLENKHI